MKKRNIIEKNEEDLRIVNLLDDYSLYKISEDDKNSIRMKWLDAELEKVDQLLKAAHKNIPSC